MPASVEERGDQSSTASDTASAPASRDAVTRPESNMYGESVINVPPLSVSDDEEEEEDSRTASSHAPAGTSTSAQPVSSLDFSGIYSLFYRESPKPKSQSVQSTAEHVRHGSQATSAIPVSAQTIHSPYAKADQPMAADVVRPDTAHESQQRPRGFSPSDSASLEEHPGFAQDASKASPASVHAQPDPKEAPERLKLGSASGGSDDDPPAKIRTADSWHISAEKDGRGMHVTFQASNA